MKQMKQNLSQKIPKYFCEKCEYKTDNKKDYTKHLGTLKHQNETNETITPQKNPQMTCDCGLVCNSRTTLWRHKKKCIINDNKKQDIIENTEFNSGSTKQDKDKVLKNIVLEVIKQNNDNNNGNNSNNELIQYLINENKEFKNLILEIVRKDSLTVNNTNNNISNCNNKSFNLNFFLNEQCKDALNINEFVDSIKMQLSDLEEFAHIGYADGVSNIFVKGINALEVHKRPIHCSDVKREVLYIKNNNEWIKETEDKPLVKDAIKRVAFKNIRQINDWVKENPTCKDPTTKKFDQYNKIVMNAMSGVTEQEQKDNIEKIVKNVTKAVVIDKYVLQ
jgi:hypothetical protein